MSEAKQMCLEVLLDMLSRKDLLGTRKTAKALGTSQAVAKALCEGNIDDITQDEIIKYTATLIQYRPEG